MESKKKLTIEVDSNLDDVIKDMAKLKKGFENTQKSVEDTNKALQDVAKATENNSKATEALANGFKGIGLATKAMGIGLLMDGLNMLKDIFMKNEKVAKLVATAMETISIVFTEVVDVIVDVVEKVSASSNGFEHLGKVISGLLTLSFTPLKLAFYAIKLAVEEFRLAWEESVFGDGDAKVIADLNKRISATKDSIVETGKDAVKAGKDVATNLGGAIKEVGQVVEGSIDGISKISISGAMERAKANVELQNNAKLAAAEQARLIEIYDRQAEKLRQIRDDDSKSIAERQAANDKLKAVLDQQEAAMLKQANLQIQAAQMEVSKNATVENRVALTEALANKEGVLAQIEGLRSEQLVNKNALTKEAIALQNTEIEGSAKRAQEHTKFTNSMIKDTTDRLEAERVAIIEEGKLEDERLAKKRDTYTKGTQAWADANQELLNNQQKTSEALITNERATTTAIADENKAKWTRMAGDELMSWSDREAALAELKSAAASAEYTSEEARVAAMTEIHNKELAMDKAKIDSRIAMVDAIAGLVDQESGLGRALIIAKQAMLAQELFMSAKSTLFAAKDSATKATIKGAEAGADVAAGAAKTSAAAPFPANIPMIIGYAVQAVGIITAVTSAVKRVKGASAPSVDAGSPVAAATAPQFNVVGNSGVNQLAETMRATGPQAPIQAYVVANDVSSAQSLNRNIVTNASMG